MLPRPADGPSRAEDLYSLGASEPLGVSTTTLRSPSARVSRRPFAARCFRRPWQTDQERFDLYVARVGSTAPPLTALRTSTIISVLDRLPRASPLGEG
jgi:hypothetical protein